MSIKRINNELKIIENYLIINNLNISFENNYDRRILYIYENSKLIMNIHLPNSYPFKPYDIKLIKHYKYPRNIDDTINYNKWLSNIKIINNKYHKLFMSNLLGKNFTISNDSCCFCCSSITCCGNWNPSLKIENAIIEYKKFLIYKLYSSSLMLNYLEKLYSNLFPKLSDDLKEYIFTFL
jgi:ubiquitin-protein ligase